MIQQQHSRNTMSAFLLLFFTTTLLLLPQPSHAATVMIRRQAVESAYFNETTRNCEFSGEIRLAHPMSVGRQDQYYVLGSQMLESAHMTLDQINAFPRCGVHMQGKNYSLSLTTFGDESSKEKTQEIAQQIVSPTVDFLLAGYSSSLTAFLTPTAQNASKVCVTAGSSRTSVHSDKDHVFGLLPPAGLFLDNAFKGPKAQGAKTVAFIAEEDIGTCDAAPDMAIQYDMEFLEGAYIPENAPLSTFVEVAKNMSHLNPDLMITCVRTSYNLWNNAMRSINWTPKAQVYTIIIGTPEFEEAIGPVDLPYISGVSAWSPALPPIPDGATYWTPRDFATNFEAMAFRPPAYQHTSMSASVSVLVQAMERVGTFANWTARVREELATSYFPTVYGNVSFDSNGQSEAPYLLLQYDHNNTLHVLYPQDRVSTEYEMFYPLPTWAYRDCTHVSKCAKTNGTCDGDGICQCPTTHKSVGVGPTAECLPPPPEYAVQESTSVWSIVIPTVIGAAVVLIVAMVMFYFHEQRKRTQADAAWQVDPKNLIFHDPPEVIGRGSFGLVLLAEYRGTTVAVKRVLPPKKKKKKTGAARSPMKRSAVSFDIDESSKKAQDDDDPAKEAAPLTGSTEKVMNSGMVSGMNNGLTSSMHSGSDGRKSTSPFLRSSRPLSEAQALKKLKQEFVEEMRYISKLRHPNVVNVMGAVIQPGEEPMLIMEYMDHGSLYDILHNNTMYLEGDIILPMLRDITQGCRFLHASDPPIIHGDLKAANILVDSRMRAKVADFGLSQKKEMGAVGTPFWMAPELIRGETVNTSESDVYSFGMILYEVYSRKDPYEGEDPSLVLLDVADKDINYRPPVPHDCPPQLAGMMTDCLSADADQRPTFEELDKRLKRVDTEMADPSADPRSSRFSKSKTVSLYDIFPKHIADAMSEGKKIEAEHKDCVTIYFSDIVGFTNISSTLEPRKVADMLDRLYLKFDTLSHKHDIFKVETIGDAYMAVTNLVKDQPDDHAKRIAEFSVDAIQAANETLVDLDDPEKGHVNIRVGFHSGPVVADVVGSRNPRYCLFGDTVNTASRMESNSITNRIHCSESSASILKKQNCIYPIKSRGVIEVKGKGEMHTYWINESPAADKRNSGGSKAAEKRDSGASLSVEKRDSGVSISDKEALENVASLLAERRDSSASLGSVGSLGSRASFGSRASGARLSGAKSPRKSLRVRMEGLAMKRKSVHKAQIK